MIEICCPVLSELSEDALVAHCMRTSPPFGRQEAKRRRAVTEEVLAAWIDLDPDPDDLRSALFSAKGVLGRSRPWGKVSQPRGIGLSLRGLPNRFTHSS
jgi:hypothetical protein